MSEHSDVAVVGYVCVDERGRQIVVVGVVYAYPGITVLGYRSTLCAWV